MNFKDIPTLAAEVGRLTPKAHKRFKENLLNLVVLIQRSFFLRGPYRLVLDSNILMRLESYRVGNTTEGLLSVLLAINFLKRLPFQIDLVIRPSVFYEFLRLKNVSSTREHWEKFKELKTLIEEELEVTLFFDGIETYAGAEYYGKLIEGDAKKMVAALLGYKERDWRFNFIRELGDFDGVMTKDKILVPPYLAARGLYTELGLDYFDERKVSCFFIDHIEKHLCECKDNDQQIIKKYANPTGYLLTRILTLSAKGQLNGLADVDIFSLCNLQSQFNGQAQGRYMPASIGFSLDENLSNALHLFSSIQLGSEKMMGGEENLMDNKAKMEAFLHDQARVKEGEKRENEVFRVATEFLEEIKSYGFFNSSIPV